MSPGLVKERGFAKQSLDERDPLPAGFPQLLCREVTRAVRAAHKKAVRLLRSAVVLVKKHIEVGRAYVPDVTPEQLLAQCICPVCRHARGHLDLKVIGVLRCECGRCGRTQGHLVGSTPAARPFTRL